MVDDQAVLPLRAEHDDLGIGFDLHIVPRWPVEEVIRVDRFARPAGVPGGHHP